MLLQKSKTFFIFVFMFLNQSVWSEQCGLIAQQLAVQVSKNNQYTEVIEYIGYAVPVLSYASGVVSIQIG